MKSANTNKGYNVEYLEERFSLVLNPLLQRVLIETRRQQSVMESLQKEYDKTKAQEFLGGIETTKGAIRLIEGQLKQLERVSSIIDEAKTATAEGLNSLSQEFNSIISTIQINDGRYDEKWKLSEQELNNLKIAFNNVLYERIRRSKSQTNSNIENFENKKESFDKANPLRQFFAKLSKKQATKTEAEEIEVQKGNQR